MNSARLNAALDAWITGSYGDDHPDNFGTCADCGTDVRLTINNEDDDELLCYRCGRAAAEEE